MKSSLAKRNLGFSLIELMVVVAIIGILATVGYPSYTEYVQRGKIAEATSALSDMRIRQERFFQDNRTYASAGTTCGANGAWPTNDSFSYTCVAPTATTFTVTATGLASRGMNGFVYTVNENNQRTTVFPGVAGTQSCWITRKGETC